MQHSEKHLNAILPTWHISPFQICKWVLWCKHEPFFFGITPLSLRLRVKLSVVFLLLVRPMVPAALFLTLKVLLIPLLGLCLERYIFGFLCLVGAVGSKLKIVSMLIWWPLQLIKWNAQRLRTKRHETTMKFFKVKHTPTGWLLPGASFFFYK